LPLFIYFLYINNATLVFLAIQNKLVRRRKNNTCTFWKSGEAKRSFIEALFGHVV